MQLTTEKVRHPKLDYVKESLVLLADIVNLYPIVKSGGKWEFVHDRYLTLMNFNKNGLLTQSIRYISEQFNIK